MYETFVNFDRNLFMALNSMHSGFMDTIMWWAADRFIWIPFYILLAVFLYRKFGTQSIVMILFAAILITLSDQGSVLMKNLFERERPCHDETLSFLVHTVNDKCGGKYGFVSSHAANSMALFVYLLLLARNTNRTVTYATGAYVLLIGYCRIYLGVHFPADIVGGWLIGALAALITYIIYRLIFDSPRFDLKR